MYETAEKKGFGGQLRRSNAEQEKVGMGKGNSSQCVGLEPTAALTWGLARNAGSWIPSWTG